MTKSLGKVSAIIGAQWGDEGKGKVVDIVAEHYDVIARACGGANAGQAPAPSCSTGGCCGCD